MEDIKTKYTAEVTVNGDRNGHVSSSDDVIDMDVAMPKEMGGPGGNVTNPEQLFAAAWSACFGSAVKMVAKSKNIEVKGIEVTVKVSIGETSDGGFGLAAEILGKLPDLSKSEAEDLMQAAHQACPYSKATRGNIDVKLGVR